jgi:hypothetical protein
MLLEQLHRCLQIRPRHDRFGGLGLRLLERPFAGTPLHRTMTMQQGVAGYGGTVSTGRLAEVAATHLPQVTNWHHLWGSQRAWIGTVSCDRELQRVVCSREIQSLYSFVFFLVFEV